MKVKMVLYFSLYRTDCVFCAYCMKHNKDLLSERNKEQAYVSVGFSSWKKAPKCFEDHQQTNCHKAAAALETVVAKCGDVGEIINQSVLDSRQKERKYLIDVIRCLRYLAKQGIAIQGNPGEDNFTQLLKLLGTKDPSIQSTLEKTRLKYTHNEIQNELLDLMAQHVLREKLKEIRENDFFAIMADEYTDISNLEQLSMCLRTVSDDFEIKEDFLGFYELNNIKSDTIVHAIKDVLLRSNLSLQNCRGQTYDGASNMMGKKSGVATQIKKQQPKAIETHCHGHSLSLAVKDLTSSCDILSNTMATVGEICVLIKYSPKREKVLGTLDEDIEGELCESETQNQKPVSIDKLCKTRWTVRASCFNKIFERYHALQSLWKVCLSETLESEVRARIIGCRAQMETFNFFFGLLLSHRIYSITDNLSKTLQKEKMSALNGQRLARLTLKTLQNMRTGDDFKLFFDVVIKKADKLDIEEPSLPRKRRKPKYSILQYVEGHETTSKGTEAHYPQTAADHYRSIYYDAIDTVTMAIKDRFEQPSYQFFSTIEQLLINAINGEPYDTELGKLDEYMDDFDISALPAELMILRTMFANKNVSYFEEIKVKLMNESTKVERSFIKNVIKMMKLVFVGAATSATPERSFSLARRLKTWLRSTMLQKRFNSLAILSFHKEITDKISLVDVANEFVATRPTRKDTFGKFSNNDL